MGRPAEDYQKYINKKFGKLSILSVSHKNEHSIVFVNVNCDCGNSKTVRLSDIKSGRTTSCGCHNKEVRANRLKTHGETGSNLHFIWLGMKDRCNNSKNKSFSRYGGRGIRVCNEWQSSYELFSSWARSKGYKVGLSLDRIDNNKGYSPNNCRWADSFQQANNKRNNKWLTFRGKTQTESQWARELGIDQRRLNYHLRKGRSLQETIDYLSKSSAKSSAGRS